MLDRVFRSVAVTVRLRPLGACLLVAAVALAGCGRRAPVLATPTATSVPLDTQVAVVIPTTTPAPTATNTVEPTATRPRPTATVAVRASPTEAADEVTAEVGANVRSGPGLAYPVVAGLNQGESASVLGRDTSATWFAIGHEGAPKGQGWIAALVVSYGGEIDDLPVITAPPPPPASATPRAAPTQSTGGVAVGGANGLTGRLSLCNVNKTTYAVGERVCFVEWMKNNTGSAISYGILGVQASSTAGGGQFQTSWSGELAPNGVLWIDPGCEGPTDRCGGAWEDGVILRSPGTYHLTLQICFSDFGTCLGNDGQWASLSSPIIITVN